MVLAARARLGEAAAVGDAMPSAPGARGRDSGAVVAGEWSGGGCAGGRWGREEANAER